VGILATSFANACEPQALFYHKYLFVSVLDIGGTLGWLLSISVISIDIERKNRLLRVCYVPTTSTTFLAPFFFLLWPLTVIMKQTMQAVCTIDI
jgi:hypothetical protein